MNPVAPNIPLTTPPVLKPSIVPIMLSTLLFISFVGVSLLVYQNIQLKKQIAKLNTPVVAVPSPSPTPSTDPTANWKIYSNSRYLFKYPQMWETQPIPNGAQQAILLSSPDKFMSLSLSLDLQGIGYECLTKIKEETITIDAQKVTKTTFTGAINDMCGDNTKQRDVWISIPRENKIDHLTFSTDEENFDKAMEIFDQILSTFKFVKEGVSTDPETHKSWTTYTDKDAKFLIQYPQGWTLRKTYGASVNNTANYRVSGVDISTNLSTGSTVVVNIIDPKNETFENWVKLHSGEANVPSAVNSSYKNIPAYRFERFREGKPAEVVTYYALSNNLIVFLALNPSLADQAVGELILSSFKFTN